MKDWINKLGAENVSKPFLPFLEYTEKEKAEKIERKKLLLQIISE